MCSRVLKKKSENQEILRNGNQKSFFNIESSSKNHIPKYSSVCGNHYSPNRTQKKWDKAYLENEKENVNSSSKIMIPSLEPIINKGKNREGLFDLEEAQHTKRISHTKKGASISRKNRAHVPSQQN